MDSLYKVIRRVDFYSAILTLTVSARDLLLYGVGSDHQLLGVALTLLHLPLQKVIMRSAQREEMQHLSEG
jgi:hypothetical protein